MRFAQFVVLGSLALMLAMPNANAQDNSNGGVTQEKVGRNFGSVNCQPSFPCGGDNVDYVSIANNCSATGLGLSTDFSGGSLDASDCMTAEVGENGKQSSAAVCCVSPLAGQDGICKMSCSFMLYQ